MRPAPAFQCYAADWLANEHFRLATLQERGLLWTMLNQAWVSESLPADGPSLAKLLGLDAQAVHDALSVDFRLELTRHFHSNLTRPIVA